MSTGLWVAVAVTLAPISVVAVYFWRAERAERRRRREANPPQVAEIRVNGRCSPGRLVLRPGRPLRLIVTRADDGESWWDDFEFPYRHAKRELPEGETVVVDVGPLEVGEYAYFCAGGTKRGTLVVEEAPN